MQIQNMEHANFFKVWLSILFAIFINEIQLNLIQLNQPTELLQSILIL